MIVMDFAGRCLTGPDGRTAMLTGRQFDLLAALWRARGRVLSVAVLMDALYETADAPFPRIITVFVHQLRRQMAAAGIVGLIETVNGTGYVIRRSPELAEAEAPTPGVE